MATVKSNAPKVPTGVGNTPPANNSVLTSDIGSEFHNRPASTEGTEISVHLNDGTGLCK